MPFSKWETRRINREYLGNGLQYLQFMRGYDILSKVKREIVGKWVEEESKETIEHWFAEKYGTGDE